MLRGSDKLVGIIIVAGVVFACPTRIGISSIIQRRSLTLMSDRHCRQENSGKGKIELSELTLEFSQ